MSKLPEFLQDKSCFDGRPHPAVPEDFLIGFYQREAERRKHMKQCDCCGRWFTPKSHNQRFCTTTCKQKYYSQLYAEQRQLEIDYELENGGWNE
jgi:hypothetical protein